MPTPLYLHLFLMGVAWIMIVSAVIIVAVGLSPENISKKQGSPMHNILGYIMFSLILFQPVVGFVNLQWGGELAAAPHHLSPEPISLTP